MSASFTVTKYLRNVNSKDGRFIWPPDFKCLCSWPAGSISPGLKECVWSTATSSSWQVGSRAVKILAEIKLQKPSELFCPAGAHLIARSTMDYYRIDPNSWKPVLPTHSLWCAGVGGSSYSDSTLHFDGLRKYCLDTIHCKDELCNITSKFQFIFNTMKRPLSVLKVGYASLYAFLIIYNNMYYSVDISSLL